MKKIVLKRKSKKIGEYPLEEFSSPITIGRSSDNIIVIEDDQIKSKQLVIDHTSGAYVIKILSDATDILLNNRKLEKQSELRHRDQIKCGNHELVFYNAPSHNKKQPKSTETRQFDAKKNDAQLQETSHLDASDKISKDDEPRTRLIDSLEDITISEEKSDRELDDEKTKMVEEEMVLPSGGYRSDPVYYFHYLIAIYGPYEGQRYKLNFGDTKIGRDVSFNDIVINKNEKGEKDPSISRRHATIRFDNGRYLLSDKRSQTRTYLNQHKLSPEEIVCLQPNDEIEIASDQKSTIFRFVRDGEWNVKRPQKAGPWRLHYQTRIFSLLSIMIIIFSGIFFFSSLAKINIINQKPLTIIADVELWYETENYPGILPFTPNPALSDINGDGVLELILINSQGHLTALNGKSKKTVWGDDIRSMRPISPTSITLADMNNDGLDDIIIADQNSRVYVFNGKNGLEIHKSDFLSGTLVGAPAVADLNNDGNKDIAICAENGTLHIGTFDPDKISWRSYSSNVSTKATPTIVISDSRKILFGTESGLIPIFNFLEGKYEEVFIDVNDNLEAFTGKPRTQINAMRSNIAYGKVADFKNCIVVATRQFNLISFDESNEYRRLWYDEFKMPEAQIPEIHPSPVLGDLNNDNNYDVIYACHNGVIKSYIGYDAESAFTKTYWEIDFLQLEEDSKEQFLSNPALADLNKDNIADVIIGGSTGTFYVLDGASGSILYRHKISSSFSTTPLVGDINNDGYLDILCLADDYNVYRYKTNTRVFNGAAIWKQKNNDSFHSGRLYYKLPSKTKYVLIVLVSLLLLLMIVLLYYKEKNRQKRILVSFI